LQPFRLTSSRLNKKTKLHYAAGSVVLNFRRWVVSQHQNISSESEFAMLVLKRRIGEEIIINENIRIVVSQTTDSSCSLAIEAPASIQIRRAELPAFQNSIVQKIASSLQVQS
jgi:carbon storage regulator CsrA